MANREGLSIIKSIDVRGHAHFSLGCSSKLTSHKTYRVPPRWLFVRVETSDGLVGWGEGSLEGHTEAVEGTYREFQDRFIGYDADNIQNIWQTGYRAGFYRGGPVLMVCLHFFTRSMKRFLTSSLKSALSGLDIALWDIKGKKLGVPIWQLLGGKVRDRVKVYGWIGGDNPSDVVEGAKLRRSQGFTAVKMNATGKSTSTLPGLYS